jgi:hypothetical protein
MRKCANISPYIRRPLAIYDFATAPFSISSYMRKKLFSFLSVYLLFMFYGFLPLFLPSASSPLFLSISHAPPASYSFPFCIPFFSFPHHIILLSYPFFLSVCLAPFIPFPFNFFPVFLNSIPCLPISACGCTMFITILLLLTKLHL